jgi:hypothetical protein
MTAIGELKRKNNCAQQRTEVKNNSFLRLFETLLF